MRAFKIALARVDYLAFRADGWERDDALYMASVVQSLTDEEAAELALCADVMTRA